MFNDRFFPSKTSALLICIAAIAAGCSSSEETGQADEPDQQAREEAATAAESGTQSGPAQTPGRAPHQFRLNDTGVVFAGNHPRTVNDNCEGIIDATDEWVMGEQFEKLTFSGQDCEFGRDAQAADSADGHAGFSLVKLDDKGAPLPAAAEQWTCVLDNVTGLVWEAKVPSDGTAGNQGLHDADDKFSSYSTNSLANGGEIGNWNKDWADCAGYKTGEPLTFCNTQSFVERVNAEGLCGFNDWRVPGFNELLSIVNYGQTMPAAEPAFFGETQPEEYWTSSIMATGGTLARYINFRFGTAGIGYRSDSHFLRLVRSEPAEAPRPTETAKP